MDRLDEIIIEIQETSSLSADGRNALHGATSHHPWCYGKSFDQRKNDVLFAIGGMRSVSSHLQWKVSRLSA